MRALPGPPCPLGQRRFDLHILAFSSPLKLKAAHMTIGDQGQPSLREHVDDTERADPANTADTILAVLNAISPGMTSTAAEPAAR